MVNDRFSRGSIGFLVESGPGAQRKCGAFFGKLSPHVKERDVQFQGLQLAAPVIDDDSRDHRDAGVRKTDSQRGLHVLDSNPVFVIFEIRIARPQQAGNHDGGAAGLRRQRALMADKQKNPAQQDDASSKSDKQFD